MYAKAHNVAEFKLPAIKITILREQADLRAGYRKYKINGMRAHIKGTQSHPKAAPIGQIWDNLGFKINIL